MIAGNNFVDRKTVINYREKRLMNEVDKNLMTLDELKEKLRPCNYATIAKRLGVTRQAVSQIVNGKRRPGLRILKKLGLQEVVMYKHVRRSGSGE